MKYIFAAIFVFLMAVPAHASECKKQCAADCTKNANAVDIKNCVFSCDAYCNAHEAYRSAPPSKLQPRKYGAIAISPGMLVWEPSGQHSTQQAAEDDALQKCSMREGHPKDCKTAIWFYDACGAVAVKPPSLLGKDNGAWGSAWGNELAEAEKGAIEKCSQHTEQSCSVVEFLCFK